MKILIVASYNQQRFAPFVREQVAALVHSGCEVEWFGVTGKGIRGYLSALPALRRKIEVFSPDVVHAHYGLCGLLANMQRLVPVVTTYHGSDINEKLPRVFSKVAMLLSAWNIFVSRRTMFLAHPHKSYSLLPCGIDLAASQLTDRQRARAEMHLSQDRRYVLFAGAFDNHVKNSPLAKATVAELNDENTELLELKGYTREQVTKLMCAADALLLTSFTEGSPQVVKEAMACGCPVVSVDVGDVMERLSGVDGCYVAETRSSQELAGLLRKALAFNGRTKGRDKIIADGMDNKQVAKSLMDIYQSI